MGVDQTVANVVGLGGSMAQRSGSLSALRIALSGAEEAGATTELLDLRVLDLPMYRPDAEPTAVVERFCDLVHSADALLWSSPLYHGTVSGSFKNALDWLQLLAGRTPPYLSDKVIGLIAAAGGVQGLQAVNTMEFVVRALRGWAVPLVVPVAQAWRLFDDEGRLTDPAVEGQLRSLGREVASVCLQRRGGQAMS